MNMCARTLLAEQCAFASGEYVVTGKIGSGSFAQVGRRRHAALHLPNCLPDLLLAFSYERLCTGRFIKVFTRRHMQKLPAAHMIDFVTQS